MTQPATDLELLSIDGSRRPAMRRGCGEQQEELTREQP